MAAKPPIILNFDGSVGTLPGAQSFDLTAWQERIRFAASRRAFCALSAELARLLPPPAACGPCFLGSGDYHHVSTLLIKRLGESLAAAGQSAASAAAGPGVKLDVLVLDNHPDNMRYPFGIHCGSWISHLAALPFIGRIDVAGITSNDIGSAHAVENRLRPLLSGKLTYWSVGVSVGWARRLGLGRQFRNFASEQAMIAALLAECAGKAGPLYFSLDKDVLARNVAQTNWDQGQMQLADLTAIIKALKPRMVGADIVGEVSDYHYRNIFKRLMSRLDGQEAISAAALAKGQAQANDFNRALLPLLYNAA